MAHSSFHISFQPTEKFVSDDYFNFCRIIEPNPITDKKTNSKIVMFLLLFVFAVCSKISVFIEETRLTIHKHLHYRDCPLSSLRCSRTCELFLNVNIVRLRNGSRKRVHGAISHYGPRSSAWLSTRLFSSFVIENKMVVSAGRRNDRSEPLKLWQGNSVLKTSLKNSRNVCTSSSKEGITSS